MAWSLPRFDYIVGFAGASHEGKRKQNEDAWFVDPVLGLFVVTDGMGGHAAGDIAARIAIDAVVENLEAQDAVKTLDAFVQTATLEARQAVFDAIRKALQAAHQAVLSEAERSPHRRGMGCTVDAALLLRSHVFVAHVGDGRAYLARPATTIQLTDDHTLGAALIARGVVTPSHPPGGANALVNAVGVRGKLNVDEVFTDVAAGDRLLLCTDGIHGVIEDETDLARITRQSGPADAAWGLVKGALDRGGKDNATALVLEIGERRVKRGTSDGGFAARDAAFAAQCPLFSGIADGFVSRALAAAVEVRFKPDESIPRFLTEDRVGYILLQGNVTTPQGWTLGPSSMVYPESLAGGGRGPLCKARDEVRALRIRADDLREVCSSDKALAAAIYESLARSLVRTLA